MMEPMISKRRARNDTLSYLTPEQRERAIKPFKYSRLQAAGVESAIDRHITGMTAGPPAKLGRPDPQLFGHVQLRTSGRSSP